MKSLLIKWGLIYPPSNDDSEQRDEELIKNHGLRFTDPERAKKVIADFSDAPVGDRKFGSLSLNIDLGEGHAKPEVSYSNYLNTVPRYPPWQEGIPPIPVRDILESQSELLDKIAGKMTHGDEAFVKYVFPVIRNLASLLHLLPASRSNHHSGIGGAIRHALEAADYAASGARTVLREKGIRNCDVENYELTIQVACIVSALLHDAGKPITDVSVTDDRGDEEWNPHKSTLLVWLRERNSKRYFINWRKGRHGLHELFSGRVFDKVVPPEVNALLNQFGERIPSWVFEVLANDQRNKEENKIYHVVRDADQRSVAADLKSQNSKGGGLAGIPIEKHIHDCMLRLIHKELWRPNIKGNPLWVDQDGSVFLIWSRAAADIINNLNELSVQGVLRDRDAIAKALYDVGVIEPNPYANAFDCHEMYWMIQPAELGGGNKNRPLVNVAVKIADPKSLFPTGSFKERSFITVFESDPTEKPKPGKIVSDIDNLADGHFPKSGQKQTANIAHSKANGSSGNSKTDEHQVVFSDAEEVTLEDADSAFQLNSSESAVTKNNADEAEYKILDVEDDDASNNNLNLVGELITFDALQEAKSYPDGALQGKASVPWPFPGKSEADSIAILDQLISADLIAVNPDNPHQQLHRVNGRDWIVLNASAPSGASVIVKDTQATKTYDTDLRCKTDVEIISQNLIEGIEEAEPQGEFSPNKKTPGEPEDEVVNYDSKGDSNVFCGFKVPAFQDLAKVLGEEVASSLLQQISKGNFVPNDERGRIGLIKIQEESIGKMIDLADHAALVTLLMKIRAASKHSKNFTNASGNLVFKVEKIG